MSMGGKHRKDRAIEAADMAENGLTNEEIASKLRLRVQLIPALVSSGQRQLRALRRANAASGGASCVPLNAALPEA